MSSQTTIQWKCTVSRWEFVFCLNIGMWFKINLKCCDPHDISTVINRILISPFITHWLCFTGLLDVSRGERIWVTTCKAVALRTTLYGQRGRNIVVVVVGKSYSTLKMCINVSRFFTRMRNGLWNTIMLESNNIWTQTWKIVFDIIFVMFVVLNWKYEIVLINTLFT